MEIIPIIVVESIIFELLIMKEQKKYFSTKELQKCNSPPF